MGAVSYLGRRLKPTLLKIDAIHQRYGFVTCSEMLTSRIGT
jgi:hypothetical protein